MTDLNHERLDLIARLFQVLNMIEIAMIRVEGVKIDADKNQDAYIADFAKILRDQLLQAMAHADRISELNQMVLNRQIEDDQKDPSAH